MKLVITLCELSIIHIQLQTDWRHPDLPYLSKEKKKIRIKDKDMLTRNKSSWLQQSYWRVCWCKLCCGTLSVAHKLAYFIFKLICNLNSSSAAQYITQSRSEKSRKNTGKHTYSGISVFTLFHFNVNNMCQSWASPSALFNQMLQKSTCFLSIGGGQSFFPLKNNKQFSDGWLDIRW